MAWWLSIVLMGAPLTYGVYYASLVRVLPQVRVADVVMLALSVILGAMLAAGLYWPRWQRSAGLLAGFLVFGHIVWGVTADGVSAAFVLSNLTEFLVSLLLIHTASQAEQTEGLRRASRPSR
jgi:hypothetical protein